MKSAIKISLIYIIIASLWIVLSDKVITFISNEVHYLTILSNIKGLLFVFITGLLLYIQIRKEIEIKNNVISKLDKEVKTREELIKELHHRIKNNMQVVLSLINLETKNDKKYDCIKEKISNKLISMMSVFNIVYNLNDISIISLNDVINEYVRISIRNIEYVETKIKSDFSIENITSIMLIIDSIIDIYFIKANTAEKIYIKIIDKDKIEIIFPRDIDSKIEQVNEEDLQFIQLLLSSVNGKIESENSRIIIKLQIV